MQLIDSTRLAFRRIGFHAHTQSGMTTNEMMLLRAVIGTVMRQPGITVNELARQVLAPKSRVSVVVASLAAGGILSREPDEHDKRLVRVRVTDQGRQQMSAIRADHGEVYRQLLSPLSGQQLRTIARGLELLLSAVEPALDASGAPHSGGEPPC